MKPCFLGGTDSPPCLSHERVCIMPRSLRPLGSKMWSISRQAQDWVSSFCPHHNKDLDSQSH